MGHGDVFGLAGVGVLALLCCAALPVVIAFLGALTLTGLLGGSLAVCLLVASAAAMVVRARRRRACPPTAAGPPGRS